MVQFVILTICNELQASAAAVRFAVVNYSLLAAPRFFVHTQAPLEPPQHRIAAVAALQLPRCTYAPAPILFTAPDYITFLTVVKLTLCRSIFTPAFPSSLVRGPVLLLCGRQCGTYEYPRTARILIRSALSTFRF